MEKSPKKGVSKDAPKTSQKPVLSPKPKNPKLTSRDIPIKDKNNAKRKTEVVNNSDEEIIPKRERSLSDGSVKSLSWGASETSAENVPPHNQAKRTRSNTTNKELWVPLGRTETMPKSQQKEEKNIEKPSSPEPVKPPRPKRENSFKRDKPMPTGKHKGQSETDPVKPPRRKLPQPPTTKSSPEHGEQKKENTQVEQKREDRDVVSQPIVTSTPFQENMTLAVEQQSENGRRIYSIYDDSTDKPVQHGQSFYDLLYSEDSSGTSQPGAPSASQIKDLGDDNIYDEVPLESSSQSLASLEHYIMPVDNTDELSDWGSDFDDDDHDEFDALELDEHDASFHFKQDDDGHNGDDDGDSSGSGSYEEYSNNTSAVFYKQSRKSPSSTPQRKPELRKRNDATGSSGRMSNLHLPGLKGIKGCFGMNKSPSLPYLPNRKSKNLEQEQEEEPEYVDPNIANTENYQQPIMPDMPQGLSKVQIKRYQIVKFILESEADYMKLLDILIKKYELPIRERDLLDPSRIDIIFQGVHKVLDCHVMFNIALSGRMAEWNTEEKIGDILYALFCKSMVLEAYGSYVNNFAKAMDTIKSACKTHLAFAQLLKARRQSCRERVTLHSLMLKPTKRFPQFIDLVQELLKVTPIEHPDRIPLQMALTQLEYLADNLNERRREAELRQKVKQLDASTAHISKPLSAGNRYFIRQDDFVQCVIQDDTIVRTKRQRIIMLSDMLLCVSAIKGKKDRMTNFITDVKAKYKLKWNVPLSDVEVIEYGPGINLPYAFPKGAGTNTQARPGQYKGCQEHFADLQHDLAVIGLIAGHVATLRRSYQILDNDKVQKWHKAVQRTIEEESRLANMYWLELSLPAKTGRVNYIFSTDSPSVKAEWLTALNTAVLRLSPDNNPGWYLPEDDGTGDVAIRRRNIPLLKDNLDLFLLNPKARVQEIVTCPDVTNPLPGIHDNYNNLWLLCGGPDSTGFVSVIRASCSSPPQIVESFHVCDSQILCGEFVQRTCLEDKKVTGPLSGKFGFPFATIWIGTQSGKIYIYNCADSERRYVMSVKLPDAVLAIKAVKRKVFASLGDGSLVVFKPNKDGIWDFSKPKAIGLSKLAITCLTLVAGSLWCGGGNNIHIFDCKKEVVKHVIEVDPNVKTTVRHLVCYGIGVWVSLWKQPTIKLYHSETREHVQDMNIAYTVNTMQNDIDSQFEKTKLNKLYVSCMAAEEGLLWVGTSVGLVLIFPLPRLEGIPLVSGRACVSFHAYQGRVRSLCPLRNNPDAEVTIGGPPEANKKRYQLFREHVTRDACVQTDAKICGSSYAASGPELATNGSTQSRANQQEMDDEDDVHSDEEFSFVDERPDYIPTSGQSGNHGNVSVRISTGQVSKGSALSGSILNNMHSDLVDDDFVKMMEDFQGFGSTPKASVPEPPDVAAVLSTENLNKEEPGSEKPSPQSSEQLDKFADSKIVELKPSTSAVSGDDSGGVSQGGEAKGSPRQRIVSQGQYVKLEEAQEEARAIGDALDAAFNDSDRATKASTARNVRSDDVRAQPGNDVALEAATSRSSNGIKPEVGGLGTGNDVYAPPSYIDVIGSNPNATKVFDSDSDNDSANNESFSVFSTSASGGVQSPDSEGKKQKVGNWKSKLPFPVLLITSGEGHADLRKKKADPKTSDPRIMIWQIN